MNENLVKALHTARKEDMSDYRRAWVEALREIEEAKKWAETTFEMYERARIDLAEFEKENKLP